MPPHHTDSDARGIVHSGLQPGDNDGATVRRHLRSLCVTSARARGVDRQPCLLGVVLYSEVPRETRRRCMTLNGGAIWVHGSNRGLLKALARSCRRQGGRASGPKQRTRGEPARRPIVAISAGELSGTSARSTLCRSLVVNDAFLRTVRGGSLVDRLASSSWAMSLVHRL